MHPVFSKHLAVAQLMVGFHALVGLVEPVVENVELVDVLHSELRRVDLVSVQDFQLLESLGDERGWRKSFCPTVCFVPPFVFLGEGEEFLQ